jgi:hypothetical protein
MEYREIKGYPNYMISNSGMVLNMSRNKHLKNVLADRYLVVLLYSNGIRKMHYVHRLVANAFCNKESGKDCVNHIDLNRENNNYLNLEWVTSSENRIHYVKSKKYKPATYSKERIEKLKESLNKKVYCELTDVTFDSIKDFCLARKISYAQASIKLNGKYKNNLNAHFKKLIQHG